MDPHALTRPTPSDAAVADDWDNDGFVIPSLTGGESDLGDWEVSRPEDPQPPPKPTKDRESIYLGPHGAPPAQAKKQEVTAATIGHRGKHMVKESDHKVFGTGRENKGLNAREFHRYHASNHLKDPYKRST